MPSRTLILHCDIVKDGFELLRNGFILLHGQTIEDIGPMAELGNRTAETVLDASSQLAIAGLVNAHNHSPMTLFRGMADDLELVDWLHNHIFPAEATHVNAEMVYWCTKLAAAEMLLSGTTCVADGYFHSSHSAKAFAEAGMRAIVGHGIVDFPAPGVADPADNITVVKQFIEEWQQASPLITPAVFAHSAYTCSPKTLVRAKQLADKSGVRFFIHLAENQTEQQMIIEPSAPTPLQHLDKLGLLDDNSVLIHSIWLDDEDLDILASSGAHPVLCPQSNFKLATGVSRAAEMVSRGLQPCLGTDGPASNNSMDMFAEMDIFAKSQKVFSLDPTLFSAKEVFAMATYAGGTALGLSAPCSIVPGGLADIVLLDTQAPHLVPFHSPDLLVYSARGSDVDSVFVGGQLVVKNREILTVDLAETMVMVDQFAQSLKR